MLRHSLTHFVREQAGASPTAGDYKGPHPYNDHTLLRGGPIVMIVEALFYEVDGSPSADEVTVLVEKHFELYIVKRLSQMNRL